MMKEHIVCGRLTGGLFEAQSANIGALLIRTGLAISMAVCGFVCTAALHAQIDVRQRSWDGTGCKWRICAGTQVTLHSTDTNTDRVVTTDSTGEFLFSNVNPGHFSITASHEGFSPATLNAISLVSGGLAKVFAIRESVHLRFESTFTNILNHTNYAPPATNISNPASFGVLTAAQTAENAGNRTGQVALRLEF
jgi:hypothetical protein